MQFIIYFNLILIIKFTILFIIFIFIKNISLYSNPIIQNTSKVYKTFNLDKIQFNISTINYIFSFKYNITKVQYNIIIYDDNNNKILPSLLGYNYKLHLFCYSKDLKNNINIIYIANIYENLFSCIEYINYNEIIQFGISIYKENKYLEFYNISIFNSYIIDYNNYINKKDEEFEPLIQMNIHGLKKIIKKNINFYNDSFQLKKLHHLVPNYNIKKYLVQIEEKWHLKNIYNNFFYFCKYSINSKCLYKNINQKYKYYLYLNFIDNNRNIYNKTDIIFSDFSSEHTAPGEAFLIFKEMLKQNLSVYYLTKREDIYKKYMTLKSKNSIFNPIIFDSNFINGNFLEKYFDLILRLKAVVSGAKIYSFSNFFYNIEYITYICLTHGISYIKDFLYINYYSNNIYNKIVLPPSNLIISNAKKFGWKDKDIIRIGLPRWDLLYDYEKNLSNFPVKLIGTNKSIFVMFTWRELKKNKNISIYYFKNIFRETILARYCLHF